MRLTSPYTKIRQKILTENRIIVQYPSWVETQTSLAKCYKIKSNNIKKENTLRASWVIPEMKAIPPLKYQANVINHKVAKATEKTM